MSTFRPKHRLPRGGNACDFCGAAEVQSLYRCHNFSWDNALVFKTDTGRWASCDFCSQLVEEKHWTHLNRRVMREIDKRQNLTKRELEDLRAGVKLLHQLFSENMVQGEELVIHRATLRRIVLTG